MNGGNTADVVNLDFAKAFDSVNHRFVLAKLESFGLCDKVARWVRSYLTGRTCRVQVADALSQETMIESGVPQASVIGPLLFLLFVNDLTALLFADDVKMVSPRSQSDLLQGSFYNVWKWSVNWDLPINPTKSNYIAIGRAPALQIFLATGSPSNSIQVTNVVKNLGVLIGNSFSSSIHCKETASKARRMQFMIRRSFAELSVSAFAALYHMLVQLHRECATQPCSTNLVADANPAVGGEAPPTAK